MSTGLSAFSSGIESVQHSLLEAVVFDPVSHPERSCTTLARIIEVLGIVVPGSKGEAVLKKCKEAAGDVAPFDALAQTLEELEA